MTKSPAQLILAAWERAKEQEKLTVSLIDDHVIVDLDVVDESWLVTDKR